MTRPVPNYPKRSRDGIARHSQKRHVRQAFMDPRPGQIKKRGQR